MIDRLAAWSRLVHLSARLVAGRRYWIAALPPLLWPAFLAILLLAGTFEQPPTAASAQNLLIGLPLTVLAIGLGVRIIAGEMDRRTLEIAYTVPGGCHRVWLAKLAAVLLILLVAEALLALVAFTFFVSYPFTALYGALQAAVVYLVIAMALAALWRSEVTGTMATVALLILNSLVTGDNQARISPFWNPLALDNANPADLLAWTIQNRIGFLLVIAAIVVLAFTRAEHRERLLEA